MPPNSENGITIEVQTLVKETCLEAPYKHEGMGAMHWILVDYVNIVVHIFQPETRKFYKLEEMWNDAPLQQHDE